MRVRLTELDLSFKKRKELIRFADFSYFYGQMGAGKSTIARLVDFCLGGNLGESEMTPALQSEFVSASLILEVEETLVDLRRDSTSNRIRANWKKGDDVFEVMIPARKAGGEVIPGSGIEVVSDLIYVLGGRTPPKVRKSQRKEESDLGRLSLRDLLWYCYLDQDSMDSSFFHLDRDADHFKRLKSRDVLRFLVGFHQEQVSELEVKLELHRTERLECEAGSKAIKEALSEAEIASEKELAGVRRELEQRLKDVEASIESSRADLKSVRPHAMEGLQSKARLLTNQIAELERDSSEIRELIVNDKEHKNEILSLFTRFRRSQSAREVLSGVEFSDCPRCGRELPERETDMCRVCGQAHAEETTGNLDELAEERDLDSRVSELSDLIERHTTAVRRNDRRIREIRSNKEAVDVELNRVAADYDSTYLANTLEAEKTRAALRQELTDLQRIEVLVRRIRGLSDRVEKLAVEEQKLRKELKEARENAEKDTKNLARLQTLFLDCLLKAKLPGFYSDDSVEMNPPNFLPEVSSAGGGDLATISFSNLGSGGKKTLFKCCFAVAVHRLAGEIDALLPTFFIIDSPMKNISERENRDQFEGFFEMLYDLSSTELNGTQFIVIDKEVCPPPAGYDLSFSERHMRPNQQGTDPSTNPFPPLIRYYIGK